MVCYHQLSVLLKSEKVGEYFVMSYMLRDGKFDSIRRTCLVERKKQVTQDAAITMIRRGDVIRQ